MNNNQELKACRYCGDKNPDRQFNLVTCTNKNCITYGYYFIAYIWNAPFIKNE